MSAPPKSKLLAELKPLLKGQQFRKKRTTWHRDLNEVIAVFNVQTSQWNTKDYYINIGVYLKALGHRTDPPEYECHVRCRIDPDGKSVAQIVDSAMRWLLHRTTKAQVKRLAKADSRHGLVSLIEIAALK